MYDTVGGGWDEIHEDQVNSFHRHNNGRKLIKIIIQKWIDYRYCKIFLDIFYKINIASKRLIFADGKKHVSNNFSPLAVPVWTIWCPSNADKATKAIKDPPSWGTPERSISVTMGQHPRYVYQAVFSFIFSQSLLSSFMYQRNCSVYCKLYLSFSLFSLKILGLVNLKVCPL